MGKSLRETYKRTTRRLYIWSDRFKKRNRRKNFNWNEGRIRRKVKHWRIYRKQSKEQKGRNGKKWPE